MIQVALAWIDDAVTAAGRRRWPCTLLTRLGRRHAKRHDKKTETDYRRASVGGYRIERKLNRLRQFRTAKRLLQDDSTRSQCLHRSGVAGHEQMWDETALEYFSDGSDAAAVAETRIDDHQIRFVASRAGHCVSFGRFERSDGMALSSRRSTYSIETSASS